MAVGDRVFRLGDIATVTRGLTDPPSSLVREDGRPSIGIGVSMVENGNIIALGQGARRGDGRDRGGAAGGADRRQDRRPAGGGRAFDPRVRQVVRRGARDRAAGVVPVARAAHRHGGGAVGAAGAGDRLLRDVADGDGSQPDHARGADHRARAPGRRRDHRHRDDGGEDRGRLGPDAGGRGGLGHHRLPDADRHAGDGGGVHPGRLRRLGGGGVCRRHLLGGGDRADRLVVRGGDLHALPRGDAAAAAGGGGARSLRQPDLPAGCGRRSTPASGTGARWSAATAAIFVVAIIGFGNVQQQFFPISERPELFLQIKLPEGSSITATTKAVEEAEALLEGRRRRRARHRLCRAGQRALLARAEPAAAEPVLRRDRDPVEGHRGARADQGAAGAGGRRRRAQRGAGAGRPLQLRAAGRASGAVPRRRQGPAGGAADRRRGARRDGAEPGRARSAPAVERDGAGDPAGGGPGPRPGARARAAGHRRRRCRRWSPACR